MSTQIETELMANLKTAMKAGDKRAVSAIRMVRTKIMEARTAKNAKPLDEDGVLEVIRGYVKSLEAALAEFRASGTGEDDENILQLAAEVKLFQPYMPTFLSEEATAAIVEAAIASTGATARKQMGMVMGAVMKGHKGEVDPSLVKTLIEARLA